MLAASILPLAHRNAVMVRWAVPVPSSRRVGVLTALDDEHGPAIALGDVAARHVRLRPDGLQPALGGAPSGFVPWAEVSTIAAEVPTTWWPHPALGDTVAPILEGIFGVSGDIAETPTFPVRVTTTDGARLDWVATPHYLSGYRRRDGAMASRFVEHLAARSDARVLLARPDDLLARLGEILRQR